MDLRQNPRRPLATELASSENPSGHPSENQPSNGQPLNSANSAYSSTGENSSDTAVVLPPAVPHRGWRLWLRRLRLFLFVFISLQVGVVLIVLPWTAFWTDNPVLVRHLTLRSFLLLGFVRGAVSGIGLLDLWMGIWEGVRYREDKEPLVITK